MLYPISTLLKKALAGQRLSRPERQILDRMVHRKAFAMHYFKTRDGAPWKLRPYQETSLESHAFRKVHCDGRDVGKTTEIEILSAWAVHAMPGREVLIATQTENHLFPLMHRLARLFEHHPVFSTSLVEVKRSPSWYFRFSNGAVLWGRIAGPRGVNFQGLHVDWQIVDEAQEMTETAWSELFQALNGGGRRWVYGVPNGLRNTFYRMTRLADAERYNWPSTLNPEYTPEKDAELARLYGGHDSPGYIHRVLGRHGEPLAAVFALDDYLQCVDDGLDFQAYTLQNDDPFEAPEAMAKGDYYLGCDLGYARDPSEFVVYRSEAPYLINVLRVRLEGVNYARQQGVIQALDRAFQFRAIGIDAGNNGRAVAHQLLASGENWEGRLHAIEFGASIETAQSETGLILKRGCKEFMTELLRRRMSERTIVFPRLAARESQYASHTYRIAQNGAIVYEKGNDHIIDADRCALLAQYRDTMPAFSTPGSRYSPGFAFGSF